ncbi:HSP20-7 [Ramazzottius varieornatus]|uniref:HSP20-7 n=1 Tax=Ramazzottius varieornatus TaxID=947166 RepID=A0A1D1VPU4_RAMVA|nr:HSP20-7 [Ramazzottius varieornatus]
MSQYGGSQHGTVEVRIPVMQRNTSIIEQDFGGHPAQFEEEMRKMEAEMGKLTGQINEGNKRLASKIIKTTTTTTTRTRTSSTGAQGQQQQQPMPGQPQGGSIPIQYSSPQGSVHSQSSHHTTQTHQSNVGGQQPQSIPVSYGNQGSNQQQQHYSSAVTHNVGGSQQPSPAFGSVNSNNSSVQRESSHHTTTSHQTYHHSDSGSNLSQSNNNQQLALTNSQQSQFDAQNNQELQQWLGGLDSSLISNRMDTTGQDGKCIRLRFDVSQYRADEITVKTVDNVLRISAKHEEKTENRSSYREFNKEFSLPIGTDPSLIKSTLSKDGILTVEAPLPGSNALTHGSGGYQPAISNY